MIDIANENLIPIRDVPRHLPPRSSGRHVHISTVYRWLLRGIRGVCLDAVRIGGTTYTSAEALQRFADRLTEPRATGPDSAIRTTRTRQRQIQEAARRAAAILSRREREPRDRGTPAG